MYKVRVVEDLEDQNFRIEGKKYWWSSWKYLSKIHHYTNPFLGVGKEEAKILAINKAMQYKENEVVFEV